MAVIKCKMCGGDMNLVTGETVAECEYCGSKQTVPTVDSEKMMTLFARANRLRFGCEFDKAAGVYENIVAEFPEEAEAYWGLFLCKYGIEYVDDPATGKKVPTCHRSSFNSVMDDGNFDQACENADAIARRIYREEAKAIEELRKGIIEVSGKEEPYDIFICYKETSDSGERTLDSVLAQDIYNALTEKEYRVFFSRVTLESKLGQEYEPYIFAALHSARVMLAIGTDYEHYNAVWVKNEWSRFLALIAGGEKKTLIPCYKGIDAYDMPKEFARLQAQDLGKVGAMQDLLRGIEKLLPKSGGEPQPQTPVAPVSGPNVIALLKRGNMALEDGEWAKADEYFDSVLNMDAECGEAYLGKFLSAQQKASIHVSGTWLFNNQSNKTFTRAVRFASSALKKEIDDAVALSEEMLRREEVAQRIAEETRRRAEEENQRKKEEELRQQRIKLAKIRNQLTSAAVMITAGYYHTVGLRADGMVVDVGDTSKGQRHVTNWTDIVAIAAGRYHTVGLRADGTVVAVGWNLFGQCDVSDWTDIVAIAAGDSHTVGLRTDGTVVATKHTGWKESYHGQCDVSDWTDIVAIDADRSHTIGLRADRTVVTVGENHRGECDISGWTDIVAIAAGEDHTVGLRVDGTVVVVGDNRYGQCDTSDWSDIVAIAAGECHTVGLRADGTVVGVGKNTNGLCDVSDWINIVAIAAGSEHTVGLRVDGTVVAVGTSVNGQCDVSDWKLFQSPDTFDEERKDVMERKRKAKEARIAARQSRKAALQKELANLTGMFSGGQRKKLEAQIAEIDADLKRI